MAVQSKFNKFSLRTFPFFLLLLPVFFVAHGYMENYAFIGFGDVLLLAFSYTLLTGAIFFLLALVLRDRTKSAIITALLMLLFFFFGAFHDFFREHSSLKPLSKYSILLTSSIIALVLIFIFINRNSQRKQQFYLYFNTLLLIYLVLDIGGILVKTGTDKSLYFSVNSSPDYTICDTCHKPNIYFLLFDEYASSVSLKQRFGFNNDLDSFLISKGFSVQTKSIGNYDFTEFSLASILNMSFINGIQDVNAISVEDYSRCYALIKDAKAMKFLKAHGYDIINYSIFDFKGNPSMTGESFLPVKTKLITGRTLTSILDKDIGWHLAKYFPFVGRKLMQEYRKNNAKFLSFVKEYAMSKKSSPAFIYAHLEMPHTPYYFDKNGKRRSTETLYNELITDPPASYLGYVGYTNTEIKELVRIIQNNDPSAVIVLMGDHGYRNQPSAITPFNFLENMNAVYIPGDEKIKMYDSISGVNQFRVLFNGLFNQRFPMLKDSGIILKEVVR